MQAGKQVYNMYVCNAVMVVWGLLRLTPNINCEDAESFKGEPERIAD